MAIRFFSPNFIIPGKNNRSLTRVFMLQTGHRQIKSLSLSTKVLFEIEDQGIVCYRDEKGELVCEGYDEGPRITQQSHNFSHQRELEIPDFQRGRRLQFIEYGNNLCTKCGSQMIKVDLLMN